MVPPGLAGCCPFCRSVVQLLGSYCVKNKLLKSRIIFFSPHSPESWIIIDVRALNSQNSLAIKNWFHLLYLASDVLSQQGSGRVRCKQSGKGSVSGPAYSAQCVLGSWLHLLKREYIAFLEAMKCISVVWCESYVSCSYAICM